MYPCDKCGKDFSSKQALTSHTNNYHGKVQEYVCIYCGKLSNTYVTHKRHQETHTRDNNFYISLRQKKIFNSQPKKVWSAQDPRIFFLLLNSRFSDYLQFTCKLPGFAGMVQRLHKKLVKLKKNENLNQSCGFISFWSVSRSVSWISGSWSDFGSIFDLKSKKIPTFYFLYFQFKI